MTLQTNVQITPSCLRPHHYGGAIPLDSGRMALDIKLCEDRCTVSIDITDLNPCLVDERPDPVRILVIQIGLFGRYVNRYSRCERFVCVVGVEPTDNRKGYGVPLLLLLGCTNCQRFLFVGKNAGLLVVGECAVLESRYSTHAAYQSQNHESDISCVEMGLEGLSWGGIYAP